jgi:hypothetical protein
MTKEHLSPDRIEKLSKYQLRGADLVASLKHLEVCEKCRSRIRKPTKAEILARLLPDDDPPSLWDNSCPEKSETKKTNTENTEKPKPNKPGLFKRIKQIITGKKIFIFG